MPERHSPEWLHDQVVKALAAQASGHMCYTNLDHHTSTYLGTGTREISPDLILCDQENLLVQSVIEVETADTVSAEHVSRWAQTARAVRDRGTFVLLVPPESAETAYRLCQQYGIRARIGLWTLTPQGVAIAWHRLAQPALSAVPSL